MRRRLSPIERHDRALTRMVPGTLGGRFESAAPIMLPPRRFGRGGSAQTYSVTFQQKGALEVATSEELPIPIAGSLARLMAHLTAASSSGDVEIDVLRNGSVEDTITIAASSQDGYVEFSPALVFNGTPSSPDVLALDLTSAGTDASGLVVTGVVS